MLGENRSIAILSLKHLKPCVVRDDVHGYAAEPVGYLTVARLSK